MLRLALEIDIVDAVQYFYKLPPYNENCLEDSRVTKTLTNERTQATCWLGDEKL